MSNELISLLKDNLNWDKNNINSITQIGGLNNTNYKVVYENTPYFARLSNDYNIGNDNIYRSIELDVLSKASKINLCNKPIYFDTSNGNMISNWIPGFMPTEEDSNSIEFIKLLISKVKSLHNLKCNNYFNPFVEIKKRLTTCTSLNIPLPDYIDKLISTLDSLENYLSQNPLMGLCHNDLNPSNIIVNKNNLFIIDYEFASMGDIFFDLATIAWLMDERNHKVILKEYFGYFNEGDYSKLIKYLFVVKMFNATWSLLKSLNTNYTYDYLTGANMIFEDLLSTINTII